MQRVHILPAVLELVYVPFLLLNCFFLFFTVLFDRFIMNTWIVCKTQKLFAISSSHRMQLARQKIYTQEESYCKR